MLTYYRLNSKRLANHMTKQYRTQYVLCLFIEKAINKAMNGKWYSQYRDNSLLLYTK